MLWIRFVLFIELFEKKGDSSKLEQIEVRRTGHKENAKPDIL